MNELKYEWDIKEGKYLPATGRPGADTIVWTGFEWIPSEPNPEGPGALRRGLATGMAGIRGAVVDLLPAMAQSTFGYDDAARKNLEEYAQKFKDLEDTGYLARTQFGDIKDVDSFLSWFGETLGQAVPSMIPVAGGAGAGAVLGGRLLAGAAAQATGPVATTLTRDALKKTTEALIARGLPANEAAGIAARNLAQMAGATGGAFAGGWIQNAPESFKEIFDETGEMRPGIAAGLGTIKSALDTVGPIALLSKIKGAQFADQVKSRIASKLLEGRPGVAGALGGILGGLATEGITEGSQALVDELALAALNDKSIDWNKILENFAAGAALGTVVGGIGGAITARREAQAAAQLQEVRAAEAQAKADIEASEKAQAEQFINLADIRPTVPAQTPEDIKSNVYKRVAAEYGIGVSPEGKISTQDARRAAIARVQGGEAKSVTEEERRLKREMGQKISTMIGQAETEARLQNIGVTPSEGIDRAKLEEQRLKDLRATASEDITGLPLTLQQEILEARRLLQEYEGQGPSSFGEAQEQFPGGFAPRPEPLQLPPPTTYEVPGQAPLTRARVYKMVDKAIARGRTDLVPLRNLQTPDESAKIQNLIAAYTNPDITQVQIESEGVDILTAGPAGTQEQFRQTPQEFIDQVYATKDNQPLVAKYPKNPAKESPLEAAARYAYELPVGARLNQTGIRDRFKQLGLPLKDIPKIEKAIRVAHPTLFEKGIKVASRDQGSPEIFKTVRTSKPPTVVEILPPERQAPSPAVRPEPVTIEGEYVEDLDAWVDTNAKPNNLGILQLPAPRIDEAVAQGELTPSDVQDIQESGIEIVDPTKINVGDFVTLGTDQGTVISIRDGKARVAPNPKIPQFYWEVPVSSLRKAPITALAGIKEIKGKSSIDVARMIQNFGAGRYVGEPADVTIKELVQNSLDAVKEALYKNKISEGKIDVIVDPDTRKITVSDNGIGMSPEVLIRAFFTLFGSKKDIPVGLRSGGYGLAKIYMFTMGEKLELTTVDTNGVQSSVNLDTGAILSSISGKPFKITQQQTDKPSGTTVSITLKPTHIDPFTNKEKSTSIPTSIYGYPALYRPILPVDQSGKLFPISVNFDSGFGLNKISIGQDYLTKNKLDKAFTVESDAWDADVYIGKISEFPQHQFLSSGVLQFGKTISTALGPVKNDVIVNFRPKVDAIDPRYPINDTRENFKEHAGNNIKALNQIFSRIQSAQQVEDLGRLFSNTFTLPTINIFEKASQGALSPLPRSAVTKLETKIPSIVRVKDGKLLDTDNNPISFLDSDKISSAITDVPTNTPLFHNNVTISEQDLQPVVPLMAELSSVFRTLRDAVANFKAFKDYPVADNYVGISLDKNYLGIKIKAPFEAVFVNPFLSYSDPELKNNLNPKVRATLILNTMIHELSHIRNMGHDADFIGDMARVEAFLQSAAVLDPARDAIVESLVRHGDAYAKVWSQFNSDAVTDLRSGLEGSKLSSLRGPTTLPEGQLGNAHSAIQGGEKRRGSSHIRAAAQVGQGVRVPGGTGTLNIPSDTPTEIQGRVMQFVAESQQRSDALDSLDKPYTCRI